MKHLKFKNNESRKEFFKQMRVLLAAVGGTKGLKIVDKYEYPHLKLEP